MTGWDNISGMDVVYHTSFLRTLGYKGGPGSLLYMPCIRGTLQVVMNRVTEPVT